MDASLVDFFSLSVTLDGVRWLVWPEGNSSFVRSAMSNAQFVHLNAPVTAVQRGGRMEYLGEKGEVGWVSNLNWPRTNLVMILLQPEVS